MRQRKRILQFGDAIGSTKKKKTFSAARIAIILIWILFVFLLAKFFHAPHEESFKLREIAVRFPFIFEPIILEFRLGLSDADQVIYNEKDFFCRDRSQKFPLQSFNDDYCDCNDGSDEPGTSACAGKVGSLFYCKNKPIFESEEINSFSKRIYSSLVNDGVCGNYFTKLYIYIRYLMCFRLL